MAAAALLQHADMHIMRLCISAKPIQPVVFSSHCTCHNSPAHIAAAHRLNILQHVLYTDKLT